VGLRVVAIDDDGSNSYAIVELHKASTGLGITQITCRCAGRNYLSESIAKLGRCAERQAGRMP
jgi:hypothetical protein